VGPSRQRASGIRLRGTPPEKRSDRSAQHDLGCAVGAARIVSCNSNSSPSRSAKSNRGGSSGRAGLCSSAARKEVIILSSESPGTGEPKRFLGCATGRSITDPPSLSSGGGHLLGERTTRVSDDFHCPRSRLLRAKFLRRGSVEGSTVPSRFPSHTAGLRWSSVATRSRSPSVPRANSLAITMPSRGFTHSAADTRARKFRAPARASGPTNRSRAVS